MSVSSRSTEREHLNARLPDAVRETALRLESEGFACWLVGESLLQHLAGAQPVAFELATPAPVERSLELFPSSVPTQPDRGVVTVPTGGAPIDVSQLRRGPDVADDLAQRDFSVRAMALRISTAELIDPHGGIDDLEARRLRCVGDPADCLSEDPLRVLRAVRLVAEWGFAPDPSLEQALADAGPLLEAIPAGRQRRELYRAVLGEHVELALLLLRRTGVERAMVRGVAADSPTLVASMPRDLELRLAAWLRGTRPRALLRRLRFGLERSRRVERLLEHHPLDERVTPSRDRSLLKLLRQLDEGGIAALFQMREWELARASETDDVDRARKRLEAVRGGIERVVENRNRSDRRTGLALDGGTVMELLGCGPGRRVGAALRFLTEWASGDPARNEPEALRAAVLQWAGENPDPGASGPRSRRAETPAG